MAEAVKQIANELAVLKLIDTLRKYRKENGFHGYPDQMVLDDLLYFVGMAVDGKYTHAQGYDEFKQRLREHLSK